MTENIINMAGVEKTSKQGFSEAVGLPMTIMANINWNSNVAHHWSYLDII